MHNPERNQTHRILSEEDVWLAMNPKKEGVDIADSFDSILDFYEVPRTTESMIGAPKFVGIKKGFRYFCDALNDEQFDAFLEYFLRSHDQARLFGFFENLNIQRQQDFLDKLLTIVCEEESVHREVRDLRNKIFKQKIKPPTNINEAIATAEHIHVEKGKVVAGGRYLPEVIRFLEEDRQMVIPFIDGVLKNHPHGAGVIKSILEKLMGPFWEKAKRADRVAA